MINNLDLDLKFIFENSSKSLNFLDINIRIVKNNVVFDIHYKPTNSLHKLSPYTNRIVSIVTNTRENQLKKPKEHLLHRKHPQHIIDHSFTNIFQPKSQTENNDSITFIRTYNPIHNINLKIKLASKNFKLALKRKKYYYPLDNLQTYINF